MTAQFVASIATLLIVIHVILIGVAYGIMLERKIASWIQDRIGPNRTNFSFGILPIKHFMYGLGQPLADGLKFLIKEDYTPPSVDRKLFMLAPILVIVPALLGWAVMPWGGFLESDGFTWFDWIPFIGGEDVGAFVVNITVAPINIGVVYILAISSLAVYGVVIGGYASNNKYSFLGGLRATAQMLSYEIPMGLAVLIMILVYQTARTDMMVHLQADAFWGVVYHPILAIIFFTCVLAECNRTPFDLAEAESELVGGYHTEYSSMRFALYFLGEYIHMITGCAFTVVLFLGGWDIPFIKEPLTHGIGWVLVKFGVFAGKVAFLLAFMMVLRWTVPRFRFDQLMKLAWRSLIPITLVMLLAVGVAVYYDANPIWHLLINGFVLMVLLVVSPLIPQGPPVNRRVGLAGSRFSPPGSAH